MNKYIKRIEEIEMKLGKIVNLQDKKKPYIEMRLHSIIENRCSIVVMQGGKVLDIHKGTIEEMTDRAKSSNMDIILNMIYCDEWVHLFFKDRRKDLFYNDGFYDDRESDIECKPFLKMLYLPENEKLKNLIKSMPQIICI